MNTHAKLETQRLIMLPGDDNRDNDKLLKMLREDGDFRMFSGVSFSEENLLYFKDYFQREFNCLFALYKKDLSEELLGYVGIALHPEERYEVEFYVAKQWRMLGYCTEALNELMRELANRGLSMNGQMVKIDKVYATTTVENTATNRVLEKTGFVRNVEGPICVGLCFEDPITGEFYGNCINEYVFKM